MLFNNTFNTSPHGLLINQVVQKHLDKDRNTEMNVYDDIFNTIFCNHIIMCFLVIITKEKTCTSSMINTARPTVAITILT